MVVIDPVKLVVGVICKASTGSTAKVFIAFAEPSVTIFNAISFVKSLDKFLLNFKFNTRPFRSNERNFKGKLSNEKGFITFP